MSKWVMRVILNIYVSISFQWYKKLFKSMVFDPYNCVLKIRESIWDSNSNNGSSLGTVRVHSITLFALPGTCDVIPEPLSWPPTLQPPYLGRKPKVKVATFNALHMPIRGVQVLFKCQKQWNPSLDLDNLEWLNVIIAIQLQLLKIKI